MLFMVGPSFLTKPILYSDRIPCGPSNLSIGIYIIAKKRQRIKFLCSLFPFVSLFLLHLQDYLGKIKKQQPHSCCFLFCFCLFQINLCVQRLVLRLTWSSAARYLTADILVGYRRLFLKTSFLVIGILSWRTSAVLSAFVLAVVVRTEHIRFLFLTVLVLSFALRTAGVLAVAAFSVVIRLFLALIIVVVLFDRVGGADDDPSVRALLRWRKR